MQVMKRFYAILTTIALCIYSLSANAEEPQEHIPEIHSKHFFYGYPTGTPMTNDLIIRDIYALSNNDTTKFADWVAYRLDKETIEGDVKTKRVWKSDPWLEDNETLEPEDYKGANALLHTDRGHLAPLGSFKGTKHWQDTNYLSNITPQKSNLNRGVWLNVENFTRLLVKSVKQPVYVMTGPIYDKDTETLPNADEEHVIPSAYWKIIATQLDPKNLNSIAVYSFIFSQNAPKKIDFRDTIFSIDQIEKRTGLNFFRLLPDEVEDIIEEKMSIGSPF